MHHSNSPAGAKRQGAGNSVGPEAKQISEMRDSAGRFSKAMRRDLVEAKNAAAQSAEETTRPKTSEISEKKSSWRSRTPISDRGDRRRPDSASILQRPGVSASSGRNKAPPEISVSGFDLLRQSEDSFVSKREDLQKFISEIKSKEKQLLVLDKSLRDTGEKLRSLEDRQQTFRASDFFGENLAPDVTQEFIDNETFREQNNTAHLNFLKINIKLEEIFHVLVERCGKVLSVVNYFRSRRNSGLKESDMLELKDLLGDLTSTLVKSSKNEIRVRQLEQEIAKRNLDNLVLQRKVVQLRKQKEHLKIHMESIEKKWRLLEHENEEISKTLADEKTQNQNHVKRIEMMEKNLETLMERGPGSGPSERYGHILGELTKENENLKKELTAKVREIEKLHEDLAKISSKNIRLIKRVESIRLNKNSGRMFNFESEELNQVKNTYALFPFLKSATIPHNFEYRVSSLRPDLLSLLKDLKENGSESFSQQISSLFDTPSRKEMIQTLCDLYLSYKVFSEKLNSLLKEIFVISKFNNFEDVIVHLTRNARKVFNAESVNLWVIEKFTGMVYTYNTQREKVQVYINKGLFAEVVNEGKTVIKKNQSFMLYEKVADGSIKIVENSVLFPLRDLRKVKCFIEISNVLEHFGMDEEYYCLILADALRMCLSNIYRENSLMEEIRLQSYNIEAFSELVTQEYKHEFSEKVRKWCNKIFAVSTSRFLFVEKDKFQMYQVTETSWPSKKLSKRHEFDKREGVTGRVLKENRPLLIYDISKSLDYNSLVDMSSLLPVFMFPVCKVRRVKQWEEYDCLGVFQMVLKQNNITKEEKHEKLYGSSFSNECSEEILAKMGKFSEMVANALKHVYPKLKEYNT